MRFKVGLLVVALIAAFASVSQAAVLLDRVVAVVNDDVITWSELFKTMELEASPEVREMKPEEKVKYLQKGEASFLDTLINFKLQLQEAKKQRLSVDEGEVNEAVDGIKKKYGMTDAQFNESLKKEGYSLAEYRNRLREQILASKVVNREIRSKIIVSDAEVKKYLEGNKAVDDAGQGYRISQIFFRKPADEAGKKLIEERAAEVLKKLKDGESFGTLARTYSEDPSASVGGDLGFIKKGSLMKEFDQAVAGLKTGEVSAPFWSDRGLHIIRLDERLQGKSAKDIAEEARNKIIEMKFGRKYAAWVKSLREQSFVDIRL